jgi:hypothetical protein
LKIATIASSTIEGQDIAMNIVEFDGQVAAAIDSNIFILAFVAEQSIIRDETSSNCKFITDIIIIVVLAIAVCIWTVNAFLYYKTNSIYQGIS